MIPDYQDRKKRIKQLKTNNYVRQEIIGELEGKSQSFAVCRIPLELLTLNPLNSRFQVHLDAESINKNSSDYYNTKGQKKIKDWIWEEKISANKRTKKNLEEKGQLKPGVITADGLIINGNRRFVIIDKIYTETRRPEFAYLEVVVLEDITSINVQKIKEKEIRLQFGEDKKLDYSRINTMLSIRDFQEVTGWNDKEIKSYFNWSGSISEVRKTLEFIDDYKGYFRIKNYNLVEGTEDQFKYLRNSFDKISNYENNEINPNWGPRDKDFNDYKFTMFKFLRMKPNQPDLRSMVQVDQKKNNINVFVKKTVWDDFKTKIENIYQKGKNDTEQELRGRNILNPSYQLKEEIFRKKTKAKMNELVIEKKQELLNFKEGIIQEKILLSLSKNIQALEEFVYKDDFKKNSRKILKKLANQLWHMHNKVNANNIDND